MKNLLLLLSSLMFFSCVDRPTELYTEYTPVLMNRDDLVNSIKLKTPQDIKNAGKIYRYQNLLMINEKYEGVHVYDNTDPRSPEALGFIKVPGSIDMAMRNGVLFIDNATDLVALTFTDDAINVISRKEDIFPEMVPPDFNRVPEEYLPENRPANTVIIKWEKK